MTEETKFDPHFISVENIIDCDVRPILRSGGEPFSLIMGSIAKVPEGGAMKLSATFKPAPLFNVLGKQGWSHWIERGEGDDWVIWFYRSKAEEFQNKTPESKNIQNHSEASKAEVTLSYILRDHPELQTRVHAQEKQWIVDVRRMSPPEPMELTMVLLEKLPQEYSLLQINERIPQFLLPILNERGFEYTFESNQEDEVRLKIERPSKR